MRNSLSHLLAVSGLLLVLIFLNAMGILPPVLDAARSGSEILALPASGALRGIKSTVEFVFSLKGISRENDILTRQVEILAGEVARLERQGAENKALREALGFAEETRLALIASEITAFAPLTSEPTAVINRGRADGVARGDAVVAAPGILAGVVAEVFDRSSEIDLITSSNVSVNAETANSRAIGIVRGEHGLGMVFDLVSQNEVVQGGDRVVSSGLGGRFPAGLLIGQVGEIRSGESDLFQRASVIGAANLKNLRIVFVVKR